jgi:hypothetical protein
MHKDDLLKGDLLSELVLVGSGVGIFVALVAYR